MRSTFTLGAGARQGSGPGANKGVKGQPSLCYGSRALGRAVCVGRVKPMVALREQGGR